jgi:hypothetical protein
MANRLFDLAARRRVPLAVTLLLAVSAFNVALLGKDVQRLRHPKVDALRDPAPYAADLSGLPPLPGDARLAFASPAASTAAQVERELFLTRYVLAPRCVQLDAEAPWLLVHGAGAVAPSWTLRATAGAFRLYARTAP